MVSLTSHIRSPLDQHHPLFHFNSKHRFPPRFNVRPPPPPRSFPLPLISHSINPHAASFISNSLDQPPQQKTPRTLFPGGFKRPSIKVPNLVLQLSSEEVLKDKQSVIDVVDGAVANQVGIVVLTGGGGESGGKLYEAALLLKSVIRQRAYLIIDERVDISAAVNASGVLLSDQGLPAIVARNMMLGSKSESVFLPLVARNVQSQDAALDASKAEGADFLIYRVSGDSQFEELERSVFQNVRVPTFVMIDSLASEKSFNKISHILKSGASGFVISLQELKVFGIDDLRKLFTTSYVPNRLNDGEVQDVDEHKVLDVNNGVPGKPVVAGFTKLKERERQLIQTERSFLLEVIDAIKQAAPLMEEVSLLIDAVSQLDDPFLLVIVGEFNSGKSSVINALLGEKYLTDGVVPTTNEITFLRYSGTDVEQQHCERHPDGEYTCYLPAPILKEMIVVDTPGTNVILQRQQRLTEEFVPRADLVLFVLSADRPLSESEVAFLRYIEQWKKKVVFVLNKSDLYQSMGELEEAIAFVKENARKLLNVETVVLYPVSARSALEAKLSDSFDVLGNYGEHLRTNCDWKISSFYELEKYLYSFLDGSTATGIERMKLKLGTPLRIAEKLLYSCQKIVRAECQEAKKDLSSVDQLLSSVEECSRKMKSESISWERQVMSQINTAQARMIKIVESTLRLSNLNIVTSVIFKGESSAPMAVTSVVRNDIIDPALSEVQNLLGKYREWLHSSKSLEGRTYKEAFEERWPSLGDPLNQALLVENGLPWESCESSVKVLGDFSAAAASKLFEQEIREVFVGTFGGLGAAGLSASLLTSVLPSTLEDLLALGLCSTGGLLAVSNFPARRQQAVDKVKRTVDALARELEEAMQKDLTVTIEDLEKYVTFIAKPYKEKMQQRLDKLSHTLDELTEIENNLKTLQMEIQNFHVS